MTDQARLRLAEARRLIDAGELDRALSLLEPLANDSNRDIAGDAWLLIGTIRYRTDDEAAARDAWRAAADSGGPAAWLGWKSVAEQAVRDGNLEDAVAAYREADRRAPPDERGAIANRIAWLLKETGHDFAARRQFNRARGSYGTYAAYATWTLIAINVGVWLIDELLSGGRGGPLTDAGVLYGPYVAAGEWWRLITYAFLHAPLSGGTLGILHIGFNMYALYLFGPIIEDLYGRLEFLIIYLLCALGGGVLTLLLAPRSGVIGASGALFGLLGVGFVIWRRHHLLLNPRARMMLSQVSFLLVVNLVITFAFPGMISWTGHVGGLLVGGVIGFLLAPIGGTTLAGVWRTPDGRSLQQNVSGAVRIAVYAGITLVLILAAIWSVNQPLGRGL